MLALESEEKSSSRFSTIDKTEISDSEEPDEVLETEDDDQNRDWAADFLLCEN